MSASMMYKAGTVCAMEDKTHRFGTKKNKPKRGWMRSLIPYCPQIICGRMRSLSKTTSQLASSKDFFYILGALDCS